MLHTYKYSANCRAESRRPKVKLDFWELFASYELLIASKGVHTDQQQPKQRLFHVHGF